jgi:hypothetical protein
MKTVLVFEVTSTLVLNLQARVEPTLGWPLMVKPETFHLNIRLGR